MVIIATVVRFNLPAPVAPDERELLSVNMTSLTLQLGSWKSGGCPITFFVVLYKERATRDWIPAAVKLPWDVKQLQQAFVIGNLAPATWYDLLVTAHNAAGATEAEYVFATLTLTGGTVPPPRLTQAVDSQHRHIRIIVPVVCSLLVMLLVSTVVCYICSRRRLSAVQRRGTGRLHILHQRNAEFHERFRERQFENTYRYYPLRK